MERQMGERGKSQSLSEEVQHMHGDGWSTVGGERRWRNSDRARGIAGSQPPRISCKDTQPRERCVWFNGWDLRASSDQFLNRLADLVPMECASVIRLPSQESQSAIFRLPPEILSNIFLQNVLQLPAQRGSIYGLFSFLFVCRRWYSVARCSPHLWCHLGNNINHWPVFVALSKGTDLFIHMYDIYDEYRATPDNHLTAMFRDHDFYSRIREFTLDGLVNVLSYIFPEGTPRPSRLVSLSIARFVVNSSFDRPIPELLVESSSESLKRLSVSACILDIDQLSTLRQLTHLSLTFSSDTPTIRLRQLLLILQANPSLEELSFDHAYRLQEDDDEDLPFVSFTHLRKLRITLCVRYSAPLLQHLRIVSEVEEIELKAGDYDGNGSQALETFSSWLNDVVSPRAVQCIETRFERPGMNYVRQSDDIQHPNLPHHSCFVGLWFQCPSDLPAFLRLDVLHNATRLELSNSYLSASQYLGIYEMLPVLQELVTWVERKCDSVRALLPTAQDSQEDVQGGTCLSYVPLRNLSYLRIIEANLGDSEDDDSPPNETVILNLVRQRKLLGFGLHRLELVCCQRVSPGWVDELRRFVPDTFWDGEGVDGDDSDEDCSPSCDLGDSGSSGSDWETVLHDSDEDFPYSSSHMGDSDSDGGDTASSESTDWRCWGYR